MSSRPQQRRNIAKQPALTLEANVDEGDDRDRDALNAERAVAGRRPAQQAALNIINSALAAKRKKALTAGVLADTDTDGSDVSEDSNPTAAKKSRKV